MVICRVDDIAVICYGAKIVHEIVGIFRGKGDVYLKIQNAINPGIYFVYICIYIFPLPFPQKLHRKLGKNRSVIAFRHLDAKIARVANFQLLFPS